MGKNKGEAIFHENLIEIISYKECSELYTTNNRPLFPAQIVNLKFMNFIGI
jgi:hypothetical protein